MNAFKLGDVAQGAKGTLLAHSYIVPVADQDFSPYTTSTVLYPPEYEKMYSGEGPLQMSLPKHLRLKPHCTAPRKSHK